MEFETLADYQREAHKTMFPQCENSFYLTMLMLEEVGELAGKFAKRKRGDDGLNGIQFNRLVLHELGDIAWGLVEYAHIFGIDLDGSCFHMSEYQVMSKRNIDRQIIDLSSHVLDFIKSPVHDTLDNAIGSIACIANEYDISIQEVLAMNIKKLSSRKERGVIGGDGDER
ncbi:MAG: hypothetical protein GY800_08935 [Planctomycetes bacterium]|nr:hypothetical protein [Planctomycetota bacterium]